MKGYINTYDGLETWFKKIGSSRWNLYRGHVDKVSDNRSTIIYKNESEEDIDESWRMLQEMIQINSGAGGNFTIYVPGKSLNHGFSSFFVSPNTLPARTSGLAGIDGGYVSGMVPKNELKELLEKERKMWELERRLEDMEAAQGASLSGIDRVVNNLMEDGTLGAIVQQLAITGLNILSAKMGGAPAASVSMSGFGQHHTTTEEEEADNEDYAIELIDRFRPHFQSEQEMRVFLDKVVVFFEKNPVMAKTFFNGQPD